MCGSVRGPQRMRLARGTGRTGAPSASSDGRSATSRRSKSTTASPRAVGVRPGAPSEHANQSTARSESSRTHSRMPCAHTSVDGASFFISPSRDRSCSEYGPRSGLPPSAARSALDAR